MRHLLMQLILLASLVCPLQAEEDAENTTATTRDASAERSANLQDAFKKLDALPRGPRTQNVLEFLNTPTYTPDERIALITDLANQAIILSPLYGPSDIPLDTDRWAQLFREAWQTDSDIPTVTLAFTKLLINQKDYKQAAEIIKPFYDRHPEDPLAAAWYEWASQRLKKGKRISQLSPVIPIHFCVITRNPQADAIATKQALRREVDILNQFFRTIDGKPFIKFRFKDAVLYREVKDLNCPVVAMGDMTNYDGRRLHREFNRCNHPQVRDPHAINFLVKDHPGSDMSHGSNNGDHPYVLIDWARLGHKNQSPEEHEMGHALGLGHGGVPGATRRTPTNIMASSAEGFGSGGRRNLGFTESQQALILYHAKQTLINLGLSPTSKPSSDTDASIR